MQDDTHITHTKKPIEKIGFQGSNMTYKHCMNSVTFQNTVQLFGFWSVKCHTKAPFGWLVSRVCSVVCWLAGECAF